MGSSEMVWLLLFMPSEAPPIVAGAREQSHEFRGVKNGGAKRGRAGSGGESGPADRGAGLASRGHRSWFGGRRRGGRGRRGRGRRSGGGGRGRRHRRGGGRSGRSRRGRGDRSDRRGALLAGELPPPSVLPAGNGIRRLRARLPVRMGERHASAQSQPGVRSGGGRSREGLGVPRWSQAGLVRSPRGDSRRVRPRPPVGPASSRSGKPRRRRGFFVRWDGGENR